MPRTSRTAAAALLFALLVGCSGGGEATVSGTVKVDGEPIKTGVIRFEPTDTKATPVEATIADGKYTATVPTGAAKVVIRGTKVVGKHKMYDTPDSPTVDKVEELVDAQFNDQSTLKMTVERGSQQKDWDVKKRK